MRPDSSPCVSPASGSAELRREAARLDIDDRSKMGKAQPIRAVGQKRRSRSS
jgi:hypothetical protein